MPIGQFDEIRANLQKDQSQFFKDLTEPFYGTNRAGSMVSQGVEDAFWLQGMMAGMKGVMNCNKAFLETDFTEDLKKFDISTPIIHGDDDQLVPIDTSVKLSAKLIPNSELKVYPGASHGMCTTLKDQINADLLAFLRK